MDIWHAVQAIILSGDWKTLAVIAVIALAAGYTMQSMGSVVSTTVVALIAFALVEYALAITIGKQNPAGYATQDWDAFKHLAMLTLLAYGLVFAVAIGIAHTAKTLIFDR
jgi:xanthine/uracil permease